MQLDTLVQLTEQGAPHAVIAVRIGQIKVLREMQKEMTGEE